MQKKTSPRTALITGASSGVGAEFARQLLASGHADSFWLIARRRERLESLAAELEAAGARSCRVLPLDLSQDDDLRRLADLLEQERPTLAWLVNSAGAGRIGHVATLGPDANRAQCRLNVEALVAVTGLCLPHLARGSHIVQLASIAAFLPQPGFATYAATKAFVLSYSRALASELRERQISVTAVCPGPMETEFFRVAGESSKTTGRIKSLGIETVDHVVRTAIRRARAGRQVSISSLVGQLIRLISRLLPHGFILRVMRRLGFGD
ncbi:MAG: SDR family NAD(P)-dependent oxidoreductase [Bacillota bacterium]|nr:SDR family NAD(P)-dependent oxidoreductase [Bacillota bacterium]